MKQYYKIHYSAYLVLLFVFQVYFEVNYLLYLSLHAGFLLFKTMSTL